MSGKKKKKKNAGPPLPMIRLSQCMIVKNEEKNIERALAWAKPIAYEQIVVDTGSTDRTVEIAKKMGAKVFHFEWINDFAAAKNYAIEQATGNWIAFLDADEYFTPVDAKKLMVYLKNIQSDAIMRKNFLAINCKWSQVDDTGKPFAILDMERIFRNIPSARYHGKIHERLGLESENVARADEITIIHTGYTDTAYDDTGKAERNIELIRAELEVNPDDLNLKAYLADSLIVAKNADYITEAEALYRDVISGGRTAHIDLRKSSYLYFIEKYTNTGENVNECEMLCRKALVEEPGDMDYEYYLAIALTRKGENREAWELFKKVEAKLISDKSMGESRAVSARPDQLFGRMLLAAESLGDLESVVRYATMLLTADKTKLDILGPYIVTLLQNDVPEDDIIVLLGKIYDMDNANDLLLIARKAKDKGALDLARKILGMVKA